MNGDDTRARTRRDENREEYVRRIPLAAMFTALGVLFPQMFHMLGVGSTFLPMFLPVLAAGMLLPWRLSCTVAFLTPCVSWMLTGMPPLSPPVLPLMLTELTAVAFLSSWLRHSRRWPVTAVVAMAMAGDRLLLFLVVEAVCYVAGIRHPMFGPGAVMAGLPGVVLAVLIVPPSIALIEKRHPRLAVARTEVK